jgi:6-phosphofructokinase 2
MPKPLCDADRSGTGSGESGLIVTLTLNPALDMSSAVDTVEPWRKLRAAQIHLHPGGGGINVARAVREMGGNPLVVAALGGHVGSIVADALTDHGIGLQRVRVRGATRQNYAVTERSTGRQFRFVHPAARMARAEWNRCLDATVEAASDARLVVASSSLPPGVPGDFYAQLAHRLAGIDVPLIVDTSGPALKAVTRAPVLLIKPSVNELGTITGRLLSTDSEIEAAARSLLTNGGCRIVAVSMGDRGAIVVARDVDSIVIRPPAVRVVSTSGAGDSMVAGFAVAFARGSALIDAARLGVAAGTAAVLAEGTALCLRSDVDRLLTQTVSGLVGCG